MIRGAVNLRLEAVVRLEVRRPRGVSKGIEAVIDTGFNGHVSLQAEVIQDLGLQHIMTNEGRLADGTVVKFETFLAQIAWHGVERPIMVVQSAGGNLLGMSLIEGSRLTMDVAEGGAVTIEPLAPLQSAVEVPQA